MKLITMVGNKVIFIASLFSVLLFFAVHNLPAQEDQQQKVRMIIHVFEKDTLESLSEKTIDVSPMLKESFSKYDEFVILNETQFPDIDIQGLQDEGDSLLFRDVDVIVYGSYVIVNEFVRIEPIVYETEEDLFHRVNPSRGTTQGFEVLVDEVRENIFEALVEVMPALQTSVKRIAFISDFETVSGVYDDIGTMKRMARAQTLELMEKVAYLGPANTDVIPGKQVDEYLDNPSDEALKQLDPDMFIRLTYVFSGQKIVALRTDFDLLEKNRGRILKREFMLPELKWKYYADFPFHDFILNEMLAFLNRIVDANGQWDFISFPNKSSIKTTNKDVLIYRAENFAARNDFYLSSYHYYEIMERFAEEIKPEEIRLQIGFNKVYTERFEEANEEFNFVLTADPDNSYAYLGKSLINYYQGNADKALELLQTARDKGVGNAFLVEVLRGYYFYDMGEFSQSESAFQKALTEEQNAVKIRIVNNLSIEYIKIHIGLCYVGLGQYGQAITFYKELKKEFPYNKDIPYYLGNAYAKKGIEEYFDGDYTTAIGDFMASRKEYANPNIDEYLRTAFIKAGQYAEARDFIREEIKAGNYDNQFIWFDHAMDIRTQLLEEQALQDSGVYNQKIGNEVIKLFNINLKHNQNDALSYYHIGEMHTLLGDVQKGLEFMEKAYAIDDINFDIQLGLMQSYLLTGRYNDCDKLERSLSRLYRRLTVPPRFTALMNYLYISAAMARDKKAKKEIKELDKLLEEEVVIDSWYYEPYLNWLRNCDCPRENMDYLSDLTARMQERNLN